MPFLYNQKLIPLAKNLRKNATPQENHLWYDFLRTYRPRFQRQKSIGNYIADFYCHQAKLIVELDGSQHYEAKGLLQDQIRTLDLQQFGLTVVRIPNNAVQDNFSGVCEYIHQTVNFMMGKSPKAPS